MTAATAITHLITPIRLRTKAVLWSLCIILVLLVGCIDYATGYEVSAVLFYSVPILLMVWRGDRISSFFVAICCALAWWWADEAGGHHYSQDWHQVWETGVRLTYFLIFVEAGSAVKARIELLERSRQLEQEIIRISESEQERIGRDLHDGICQYFAAVGCAVGSLKRNLEKQGIDQARRAGEIEDLIMKGVVQTRGIARGLSPVENDVAGLQSALEELAERSTQLQNLHCTFECQEPAPIFDRTCATHLYYIAQECVSNAGRHGKARNAVIRLSANRDEVALTVTDDGIGMTQPSPQGRGMGLGIMQYRARVIGAEFEINARPEGGTVVRCVFPHSS
jgi:signal transduction histidine kinase